MPSFDIVVESEISNSMRCRQLEGMFDVPVSRRSRLQFTGEIDLDSEPWNVGLIVGPSGCGKSTIARHLFPDEVRRRFDWASLSVIDDFDNALSMQDVAAVCQAVGFNTIPAWLRPYSVLSTGEKFRVDIARHLLEGGDLIVMDEFTSVVDRQVARIGSHAVQKYVRKSGKKFVAISCHSDIIDWLQPDWVFEPAFSRFTKRLLRQRPTFDCEITRVKYEAWKLFASFHYLTGELNRAAKCFALWIDGHMVSFVAILPHATPKADMWRGTRIVTLPDYQGMGLAMFLSGKIAAALKGIGKRFRAYPSFPNMIRSHDRSPQWALVRKPGLFKYQGHVPTAKTMHNKAIRKSCVSIPEGRACAIFEYCGESMPTEQAKELLYS